MEDFEDQNAIRGHGDPVSFERLEELKKKQKMQHVKYIVWEEGKTATGFFLYIL